jgi:imidazolonepropionase-like amidohydrolase
VKAIADSGGRLLAGSDTPEWFHAYGFGLHRELGALVDAGLTPYRALRAATRDPAEFLGALAEWGTIAPGRRADLVLLDADPLADVRHTTRIAGVAVGGRWLDRPALDAMVRRATVRVGGGAP